MVFPAAPGLPLLSTRPKAPANPSSAFAARVRNVAHLPALPAASSLGQSCARSQHEFVAFLDGFQRAPANRRAWIISFYPFRRSLAPSRRHSMSIVPGVVLQIKVALHRPKIIELS